MNCEDVKKIILESDDKDLTLLLNQKLQEHLETCSDCNFFLKNVDGANNVVDKIKKSVPVLDSPDILANRILSNIRTSENISTKRHEFIADAILNWLLLKPVRLVIYSILLLISTLYLYQEISALKNVIALEERLNKAGKHYEAGFNGSLANLSFFYDLYKLINGEKKYLSISKDWMVVNKELIKKLLAEYDAVTLKNKDDIEKFRKDLTKKQNEFLDEILKTKINDN